MRQVRVLAALASLLVPAENALTAQTISAPPTEAVVDLQPGVAAGVFFTAISSNLTSFSFWGLVGGTANISDPFDLTVPPPTTPLFSSSVFQSTIGDTKVTYLTGGLNLVVGNTYFAYILNGYGTLGTVCYFQYPSCIEDPYPFIRGVRWEVPFIDEFANAPIAFETDYSAVPEPATVLLLGGGLIVLGAWGATSRRRHSKDLTQARSSMARA